MTELARLVRGEEGSQSAIGFAQEAADARLSELIGLSDAANQKMYQRASALYLGAEFRLQSTLLAAQRP